MILNGSFEEEDGWAYIESFDNWLCDDKQESFRRNLENKRRK